jgi:protein O-mannosyl-transferase
MFDRAEAHEFVVWDDGINVTHNPLLNPPSLQNVLTFWRRPYQEMYVPLTYTTWSLLARAARVDTPDPEGVSLDPYLFHAANLAVHLLAALAAYRLLLTLVGRRGPACAGALLFAIHPLQVEPVAWVTGMKDVLCGAFAMLALWQYVEFARRANAADGPAEDRHRWAWHYAGATLALAAAMLAKPSAVMVPAMAWVIDRWLLQRPWRRVLLATAPWFALAVACALETRAAQAAAGDVGGPLWARPLIATDALAFYLAKLVWPARLCVHYAYSVRMILAHRQYLFTWLLPIGVAIAVGIVARRRARWLAPAAILFLLPLVPVLGFVPFQFERYSVVADRYAYIAMIGPAVAIAFGLSAAATSSPSRRRAIAAATAVVLVALGARAFAQTGVWRDTGTLFENVLRVDPQSPAANEIVANAQLLAGHDDRAERLALESIRYEPHQVDAYMTLGACLEHRGQALEAQAVYRRAMAENRPDARPILALAGSIANAARSGDAAALGEAQALCRRAMAMGASRADGHRLLAVILAKRGDVMGAKAEEEAAKRP